MFKPKLVWSFWGSIHVLLTWHTPIKADRPCFHSCCPVMFDRDKRHAKSDLNWVNWNACFGTAGHCPLPCPASHILCLISEKGWRNILLDRCRENKDLPPNLFCVLRHWHSHYKSYSTMASYNYPFSFRAIVNNMPTNDSRALRRLKTVLDFLTCTAGSKVVSTLTSSPDNMQQLTGHKHSGTLASTWPSLLLPELILCV